MIEDRIQWAQDLRTAMDELRPEQRQALLMIYVERNTMAQAAIRLGLTGASMARSVADAMRYLAGAVPLTAAALPTAS